MTNEDLEVLDIRDIIVLVMDTSTMNVKHSLIILTQKKCQAVL
jgi:hypothetical protein